MDTKGEEVREIRRIGCLAGCIASAADSADVSRNCGTRGGGCALGCFSFLLGRRASLH